MNYKIRKNSEGKIFAQDCRDIINLCIKNKILQGEENRWVALWYEPVDGNPSGFYKFNFHDAVHDLMENDKGFLSLLDALKENNIQFIPSINNSDYNHIINSFNQNREFAVEIRRNIGSDASQFCRQIDVFHSLEEARIYAANNKDCLNENEFFSIVEIIYHGEEEIDVRLLEMYDEN